MGRVQPKIFQLLKNKYFAQAIEQMFYADDLTSLWDNKHQYVTKQVDFCKDVLTIQILNICPNYSNMSSGYVYSNYIIKV